VVELVGVVECAELLDLSQQRVSQLLRKAGVSGRELQRRRTRAARREAADPYERVAEQGEAWESQPGAWPTKPQAAAPVIIRRLDGYVDDP
jgi:hypothetical protein